MAQSSSTSTQRPGSLTVALSHNINADQLHKALDQILHFTGCTTCGLQGIDLRLHVGDPGPDQLKNSPGVAGVVFTAR